MKAILLLVLFWVSGCSGSDVNIDSFSIKRHFLPVAAFIYIASNTGSAITNCSLMLNPGVTNKLIYGTYFAHDIVKIIFVIWLGYYIKNFKILNFLKSTLQTISSLRYWL